MLALEGRNKRPSEVLGEPSAHSKKTRAERRATHQSKGKSNEGKNSGGKGKNNQKGKNKGGGAPLDCKSTSAAGKAICYRFNSRAGCQNARCKFEHICGKCEGSHPLHDCKQA